MSQIRDLTKHPAPFRRDLPISPPRFRDETTITHCFGSSYNPLRYLDGSPPASQGLAQRVNTDSCPSRRPYNGQ